MPMAFHPCADCGVQIRRPSKRCRPCYEKTQAGENNSFWKGGVSKNNMLYKRIQKERYPDHVRARSKVYSAIRAGRLERQPCQWPDCAVKPQKTQAHHWSYSPGCELDVTFFCPDHHRLVDRMTREHYEFIRAAKVPRIIRHTGPLAMPREQYRAVLACKEA